VTKFNIPSSLGRRALEGILLRKMCKMLPVLIAYKGSTEININNNLLIKNNHFYSQPYKIFNNPTGTKTKNDLLKD